MLAIGGSKGKLEVSVNKFLAIRYEVGLSTPIYFCESCVTDNQWSLEIFRYGTHYLMLGSLEDLGITESRRYLNPGLDVIILEDESGFLIFPS